MKVLLDETKKTLTRPVGSSVGCLLGLDVVGSGVGCEVGAFEEFRGSMRFTGYLTSLTWFASLTGLDGTGVGEALGFSVGSRDGELLGFAVVWSGVGDDEGDGVSG